MEAKYIVKRMGTFPVTGDDREKEDFPPAVHEYDEEVAEFGPFDHEEARRIAITVFEETGDSVEIYRVGESNSIASIWPGGEYMIAQQHDDEGRTLPRDQWFDFWTDEPGYGD